MDVIWGYFHNSVLIALFQQTCLELHGTDFKELPQRGVDNWT